MPRFPSQYRQISFTAAVSLVLLCHVVAVHGAAAKGIDWERVAERAPKLKVLVLVEGERPINLSDLTKLADSGLVPADRDPALVLGLHQAVFSTKIEKWMKKPRLPKGLTGRLLEKFIMTGIYRTSFSVEEKGYNGPLSLEITSPREGFGRKLLAMEQIVRPRTKTETRVDGAGNHWFCAYYPDVKYKQTIRFHFAFQYLVDMAELLKRYIKLVDLKNRKESPPGVSAFLVKGHKIDPLRLQAKQWAFGGGSNSPDARWEYRRLHEFIKRNVTYDKRKRSEYFGGRAVYRDLDDMYQDLGVTLSKRLGACPDTCVLECSFLRARGIPCRTAGRFGHFFSLVYVPEVGWVSTSVTPTGIPLIMDPGPDHVPYQRWMPRIPLKTSLWDARIRIQPVEE
ncbi:transglutaminase-like domain-containing protein [Thermodesulfobacteriota bacterium]